MRSPVDSAEILRQEAARLRELILRLPLEPRAKVQGELACLLAGEAIAIDTPRGPLRFAVFGETAGFRARGLLTKQQHTIAWVDSFAPGSVFWDIGANIGSYGLYAALRPDMRVVAFEPAAVNYFLLAANCELNAFGERMECLQVGVGRGRGLGHVELSQFAPGRSFSFHAKGKHPVASRQACLIASMDELVADYGLPCPTHVKIDVPAMTDAIVDGAAATLARPELRELHIEANEESKGGRRVVERLAAHGFGIAARHTHGDTTDLTFRRDGAAPASPTS